MVRRRAHHLKARVARLQRVDQRKNRVVVRHADRRHAKERAHRRGNDVRVVQVHAVPGQDQPLHAERVAGAQDRAEIAVVRGAVEQRDQRVFRKRDARKIVVPHFDDRQQLRGVRLAAERREQIAAQRVVDLRAHRGELVPGPVRELPVAVVEERHDLPAVFDGVVDVSHALDEEFPVLVPLVAVGLQHLKFLVCRAARVNAFRFNSF